MNDLPPELDVFASLLDAQPGPVREAFLYCLCLMMVEGDSMTLVNTLPGDEGPLCYFETVDGDAFAIRKPPITADEEVGIIEVLRDILRDEGLL